MREFRDEAGTRWEVWEVHPQLAERRQLRDRRRSPRDTPDRRNTPSGRVTLPLQMRSGWLAFQSQSERRRVLQVPDGWETADDAALRELLMKAKVAERPRRIV